MGKKRRAIARPGKFGKKFKNQPYVMTKEVTAAEVVVKEAVVVPEIAKNSSPAQPEPKALPADTPEVLLFNAPESKPVEVLEVEEEPKRKPRKKTTRKKTVKKEE